MGLGEEFLQIGSFVLFFCLRGRRDSVHWIIESKDILIVHWIIVSLLYTGLLYLYCPLDF